MVTDMYMLGHAALEYGLKVDLHKQSPQYSINCIK